MTTKGNIYNSLLEMYQHATRSEATIIEAIIFARYGQGVYIVSNWINEGGDPEIEYRGFDLVQAKKELATATRVEGFEHKNQTWFLFEENVDGDQEVLESKDIEAVNNITDSICYEVQQHFGGKYTTHETEDGDYVKLRISDHSGKHANNDGYQILSIVIADDNVTSHFYTSGPEGIGNEHFFNSYHTAQEVIDEIMSLLFDMGVKQDNA